MEGRVPETSSDAAATPAATEAECPFCGATLKNVLRNAPARCLNCGKKFSLAQHADAGAAEITVPVPQDRPIAEPRSPGYWLLKIPALIAFAAATVGTGLLIVQFFQDESYRSIETYVAYSYVPMLLWAGIFLVLSTHTLARIDSAGIHLAWRAKILKQPLAALSGSSLPYIGPLAVCGGLLPIVVLMVNPDNTNAIVYGGLFGALMFYAGFALEDVRQFIWRQELLARECLRSTGVPDCESHKPPFSFTALWSAGSVASLAAFIGFIALGEMRWRRPFQVILLPLFVSLTLMLATISIYRLCRNWDRAVAMWRRAANYGNAESGTIVWLFCRTVNIWIIYGIVWLLLMIAVGRLQFWDAYQFFPMVALSCFATTLPCFFAVFLKRISEWRQAQKQFWYSQKSECLRLQAPLPYWQRSIILGVIAVVALEASMFAYWLIDETSRMGTISTERFVEIMLFPMLFAMAHYPPLWLLVLTTEGLQLDWLLELEGGRHLDE